MLGRLKDGDFGKLIYVEDFRIQFKSYVFLISGMSCGYVHFQLSSTALVHCEGRNALERVDILKHNSKRGLSLLESLKVQFAPYMILLNCILKCCSLKEWLYFSLNTPFFFQLFKKPNFSHSHLLSMCHQTYFLKSLYSGLVKSWVSFVDILLAEQLPST